MTHASLFSGIGGFDLAAEWAGWENLFNCEKDPFCQKVLKHHFPNSKQYGDIKTTDFTIWRGKIDVLTGGFPCQPFSSAGKRKGTDDDRYLWPEMLRAIQQIQPQWIVGENVLGITNWSNGLVFEQVCIDLEAAGYKVQPYILPACGVGAPHRRYRVWFVAHHANTGLKTMQGREDGVCADRDVANTHSDRRRIRTHKQEPISRSCGTTNTCTCRYNGSITHTQDHQLSPYTQRQEQVQPWGANERIVFSDYWSDFPTQSPVCGRNDGLSYGLDGITFPRWRSESIKAYGNAIVPQVVYQILKTINEYENGTLKIISK
ncbi:MAG: DNA cytosine methyltransferase [Oscillospiraceae bacterium]